MKRIVAVVVVLLLVLAGWWLFHVQATQPVAPSASQVSEATLKDPALIAKGEYLSAVGDCASCHTAQGGARYAGGRVLPSVVRTLRCEDDAGRHANSW